MSSSRNLGMALAFVSISGHATILTTTLDNVVIGTHIYNVTFSQDSGQLTSFNDVLGAGSPVLTFTTEVDALAAATAVRDAADALNFDVTPGGIANAFALPFAFTAKEFLYFTGWSDDPTHDGVFGPFVFDRTFDLGISFATFALVAEPTTLALLGLGFAGLALSRRRRRPTIYASIGSASAELAV